MEVMAVPHVAQHAQTNGSVALDTKSSSSSSVDPVLELKYRRRAQGLATTAVIPAIRNHPVVPEMERLVSVFERDILPHLQAMYLKALENDWIDDNGWYQGVRKITGGRYEIKVLGEYFTTQLPGFDSLPWAMVEYAETQAKRDEKVQAMMRMPGGQLTFADWSIIVSQPCEEQTIHTDVPLNNVQFGLILNDSKADHITPGTKVVVREDFGPHSVDELVSGIWWDAPNSLKECLTGHQSEWVNKILDVFGPMLQRIHILKAHMAGAEALKLRNNNNDSSHSMVQEPIESLKASMLQCGDLICTSGGVPHAGPACDHLRMVMFGAASPVPQGLYDVDDQFFAHSTILFVIQAVWGFVDSASKQFLLRRLALVAQDYDRSIVEKHESTSALLTDFMHVILDLVEEGNEGEVDLIVQDFLRRHGSKTQAELFEYCPPGLQNSSINERVM